MLPPKFWAEKLLIDHFILPKFKVHWREWYLRVTDYPIAGFGYDEDKERIIGNDVVKVALHRYLDRKGQLHENDQSIPPSSKHYQAIENHCYIDDEHALHHQHMFYTDKPGTDRKISDERFIQVQGYIDSILAVTEKGDLRFFRTNDNRPPDEIPMYFSHVVRVTIDDCDTAVVMMDHGKNYRYNTRKFERMHDRLKELVSIQNHPLGAIIKYLGLNTIKLIPYRESLTLAEAKEVLGQKKTIAELLEELCNGSDSDECEEWREDGYSS